MEKKVRMKVSRVFPNFGLKNIGDVWSPPFADQLVEQGFAEYVSGGPERARQEDGTFQADDPTTPGVDEAYEGGVGPKQLKTKKGGK